MDEMTAFERQVGTALGRMGGPEPQFDALEITRSATATSPRWRFQSVFSATRFVVAGAIVALFGGLLLAGVMTTQRADEVPPPGGESPSPSVRAEFGVRLGEDIPPGVESGSFDTPLGPARWVHLVGDATTIPSSLSPALLPDGRYATLALEVEPKQLWRSPDLITWAAEPSPMDTREAQLSRAGDWVWLATTEPMTLSRSTDALDWSELRLDSLNRTEPAGYAWQTWLDAPLAFKDVTVVPYTSGPDYRVISRALGDPDGRDWLVDDEGNGLYRLVNDKRDRVLATIRLEDTDRGLRVIDNEDGTELAVVGGVSIEFIDRLASGEDLPVVSGLAVVEDDALIPVELPEVTTERAFVVDDAGFVVYSLAEDGRVYVHRSADGRTWRQSDIVGDDPDEPTTIVGVYEVHNQGLVIIESGPHETEWIIGDDGRWQGRRRPEQFSGDPVSGGWLWIQRQGEHLPWDPGGPDDAREAMWYVPADGEPVLIDTGELDLSEPEVPESGGSFGSQGFASPSTLILTSAWEGGAQRRDIWIITFDEVSP